MRFSPVPSGLLALAALALTGCGVASEFEAAPPNGYSQMGRGDRPADIARYDTKPPASAAPKAEPAPAAAPPLQTQPRPAPPPPIAAPAPPPAAPAPARVTRPAPTPAPPPRVVEPAPAAPVQTRREAAPPPVAAPAPPSIAAPAPQPLPAPQPEPAAPSTAVAPSITQPLGPPPPRAGDRTARPAPPRTGEAVASPAEVWDRLSAYLTDRGFLLAAGSDRAKGVLNTEPLMDGARPLGQLADCGTNPFESPRFHTTTVEARITPNGSGSRLSVGAAFVEVRQSAIRGVLVQGECRSRGVLEGELLNLAAGGVPRP